MPDVSPSVKELRAIWDDTSRSPSERAAAAEAIWQKTGARLAEPEKKAPPPVGMGLVSASGKTVQQPGLRPVLPQHDPELDTPAMPIEDWARQQSGAMPMLPYQTAAMQTANANAQPAGAPAPVVIPEQTVSAAPAPQGRWQPKTEKYNGAAPWLQNYMASPEAQQDPNAPAPWLQQYMGAPTAQEPPIPEASAEPVTTYAEDAAARAKAFRGLNPLSVTPDEAGRTMDLAERERMAIQQQFDAQEQSRQDIAQKADEALTKQEAVDAAAQEHERERMRQLQSMENHYRDMANAITAEPIDSERLWNSKSTGEKILATLAIGLGTLGSGVAGTPNLAWEKIQSDVDRDIDAQKANKALMQGQLAAEESLIGMARSRFQSEATAEEAMRATAYRRIEQELQRFADSAKTPERQAALQAMLIQADQKALQSEQVLRVAMQNDEARARLARAQANARPSAMQMLKTEAQATGYRAQIAENNRKASGQNEKDAELVTPIGKARTKEGATAVNTVYQSADQANTAINRLETLTEKGSGTTGVWGVGSDDYHRAESIINVEIAPALAKTMAGGFNPSGPVEERAKSLAGRLASKNAGTREAARKELRNAIKNNVAAAAQTHLQTPPKRFEGGR